jgi:hypothetical protein
MGNPSDPVGGTNVATSWGEDVVSRVVGIYASLAAAEADGRLEAGQLAALTTGSLWVKQTTAAGMWQRIHTLPAVDRLTAQDPIGTTEFVEVASLTIAAGTAAIQSIHVDAFSQWEVPTATGVRIRVDISDNGGSTYDIGDDVFWTDVAASDRAAVAGFHTIDPPAVPSGNFVARVMARAGSTDAILSGGWVRALVFPYLP